MRRFTLLTRPGCHLCEDFEAELMAEFEGRLEVESAHVDSDPAWLAAYDLRIPVLLAPDGSFVCAVQPDFAAVQAVLDRPRAV
ncbi:glutaredoxin family protein [Stagnimonas aquatica]|uniref:Glutaredoxin family protein n=1 Tax=Stagnimonas aquatica TaxID=2689987 RepID=A0A3N0UZI3_9GAMM|nr:glutaredoxin family protein [Stagnimonas aquatica]ROH85959.1 glutaredoxin family protein [Stagnimonas aquatica]